MVHWLLLIFRLAPFIVGPSWCNIFRNVYYSEDHAIFGNVEQSSVSTHSTCTFQFYGYNLRIMRAMDVKFGMKSAHAPSSCFYVEGSLHVSDYINLHKRRL
jgi:hypothetical protein